MKKVYNQPTLEAYNVKNESLLAGTLQSTHDEVGATETFAKGSSDCFAEEADE